RKHAFRLGRAYPEDAVARFELDCSLVEKMKLSVIIEGRVGEVRLGPGRSKKAAELCFIGGQCVFDNLPGFRIGKLLQVLWVGLLRSPFKVGSPHRIESRIQNEQAGDRGDKRDAGETHVSRSPPL